MPLQNKEVAAVLRNRALGLEQTRGVVDTTVNNGKDDVVYVLFQEPNASDWEQGLALSVLHGMVWACQPKPALMHCEMVVPPNKENDADVHFATYLGNRSGWNCDQEDNAKFYLIDHANEWRALPVYAPGAASKVRAEANLECGVPYSYKKYVSAVPPFSWVVNALGSYLPDTRRSSAHCATLTARVLHYSIDAISHNSSYYGPSKLFLELSERAKLHDLPRDAGCLGNKPSLGLIEDHEAAVNKLIRGPSTKATVRSIGHESCCDAERSLSLKVIYDLKHSSERSQKISQRNLATALLRHMCLREM
jgi:hypothetical protein